MSFLAFRRLASLNLRSAATPLRSSLVPRVRFNSTSTSTPPPAAKSNTGLYTTIGLAFAAGAGYWVYSSQDDTKGTLKEGAQAAKVPANFTPTKADYQKVYNKISSILETDNYDDGSYAPVLVRLAWHASGTYDKESKTGGSNYATMRFAPESLHGANNGLNVARTLLEPIKKEFSWISYGDLWTLAGVAAVQEIQGPKIPWRPGRVDGFENDVTPDGRLPDAAQGQDHIRKIFYRMGFNDQEIVALSGAHALGRCHTDRSGFEGPWTFSPTTFTNDYYTLLVNEKWSWRKWNGPKQYEDTKTKTLMMLPTDYSLIQDKKFREWVTKYAKSQDLFFQDFSKAFSTLLELGVPPTQFASPEPWLLSTVDEQSSK